MKTKVTWYLICLNSCIRFRINRKIFVCVCLAERIRKAINKCSLLESKSTWCKDKGEVVFAYIFSLNLDFLTFKLKYVRKDYPCSITLNIHAHYLRHDLMQIQYFLDQHSCLHILLPRSQLCQTAHHTTLQKTNFKWYL